MNDLNLLAINLTRRCNLACAHCYLDADTLRGGSPDELRREEVQDVLDQVAARDSATMVVLTGGEPLARRDLEAIIVHGAERGLAMVVGSNGTLLSKRRVRSLRDAGALGLGISVDSLDADYHDRFRGLPGAWAKTMAGIENCRREGLDFQIHFSIGDGNAHELPAMIAFCRATGARVLNVFFLVCTGRGEAMSDISPQRYEEVLKELVQSQARNPDLIIRARCAPHYKRVAFQCNPDSPLNRISGRDGDGCIAGIHYCRITPEGGVTACPYIAVEQGNIRERAFLDIWDNSVDFERLRAHELRGKCGVCEYRQLCGGCRARPVALGNDLMDADPVCAYTPGSGPTIVPLSSLENHHIRWSAEADRRLLRIPAFVRKLVKKRAEAYVAELGEQLVTPAHLSTLSARRFGNGGPARPPPSRGSGHE
jgi:radical SAM protein with 4Fe4S-binding SPASM domain